MRCVGAAALREHHIFGGISHISSYCSDKCSQINSGMASLWLARDSRNSILAVIDLDKANDSYWLPGLIHANAEIY